PADTIARYRACGATTVAVKNGDGDLTLWDTQGTRTIAARPVANVVDTTAAGDSFGAAFMAGLAMGRSADEAAGSAMELAAKVIQSRGALVPEIFQGDNT
ncbi:MAG TPA: PfkB family carbohydrate kinase, partial [Paracoccaceae bacterium]|nr:PfkB family carbohydrate kinase [Paracoccaceae bacterium]